MRLPIYIQQIQWKFERRAQNHDSIKTENIEKKNEYMK